MAAMRTCRAPRWRTLNRLGVAGACCNGRRNPEFSPRLRFAVQNTGMPAAPSDTGLCRERIGRFPIGVARVSAATARAVTRFASRNRAPSTQSRFRASQYRCSLFQTRQTSARELRGSISTAVGPSEESLFRVRPAVVNWAPSRQLGVQRAKDGEI